MQFCEWLDENKDDLCSTTCTWVFCLIDIHSHTDKRQMSLSLSFSLSLSLSSKKICYIKRYVLLLLLIKRCEQLVIKRYALLSLVLSWANKHQNDSPDIIFYGHQLIK